MNINNAVVNRQALALFNFWLKKQPKNKHIGDLTFAEFVDMCEIINSPAFTGDNKANSSACTSTPHKSQQF
jgi:hypothetical protein